jgi:putative transposase
VLCIDEKSQFQALNRTQPFLPPIGLGYLEGVTHDYVRHGTALFSPRCKSPQALY